MNSEFSDLCDLARATYAGRRYAEEVDGGEIGDALPFRRELAGPLL